MSPAVCRSARALTGLTQRELANAANISAQTVADYERGARQPHPNNILAIRRVFEARGIRLVEENGAITGLDFSRMLDG
jgi:transcriptional regulator with XRE-family HTH domain